MDLFSGVEIKISQVDSNNGRLEVSNLPKGYGLTLGVALRRTLLNSIEGVATTGVRIAGVSHEYSTITGVKDDVFDILLRLKKVKFEMTSGEYAEATLELPLKGKIKSGDIKVPSNVKVVSKDIVIADVTKLAKKVKITLYIEKGYGYKAMKLEDRQEIGYIPLDADFSPIKRVEVKVDEAHYKGKQEVDNLVLTIETDGSVEIAKAVPVACAILVAGFNKISELPTSKKKSSKKEASQDSSSEWTVDMLNISNPLKKKLSNANVSLLNDLIKMNREDLEAVEGVSSRSAGSVVKALKEYGLSLKK